MLYSMTGFSKNHVTTPHFVFVIQIKTLNSKGIDLNLKLPFILRSKEIDIRKMLTDELLAGKIDVFVKLESISLQETIVDKNLAKWYFEQLKAIEHELQLPQENNWMQILLSMPDVLKFSEDEMPLEDYETFLSALKNEAQQVMQFRKTEGIALERDILNQIVLIDNARQKVVSLVDVRLEQIKNKIIEELKLLEEKYGQRYDEKRLEEELIYYADKLDINEELIRLEQHIRYFREVVFDENQLLKGKKLAFIAQEMGREINTLGNKSNMYEIQRLVVEMKTALEKVKEQLSNVL